MFGDQFFMFKGEKKTSTTFGTNFSLDFHLALASEMQKRRGKALAKKTFFISFRIGKKETWLMLARRLLRRRKKRKKKPWPFSSRCDFENGVFWMLSSNSSSSSHNYYYSQRSSWKTPLFSSSFSSLLYTVLYLAAEEEEEEESSFLLSGKADRRGCSARFWGRAASGVGGGGSSQLFSTGGPWRIR